MTSESHAMRSRPAKLAGFGVAVVRDDGRWRCALMAAAALGSLETATRMLRELRSAGAVFGLLNVDDEFFIIVRPAPGGTRLLLSDATAALDYDIADDVLDELDVDVDTDELEESEPYEEGDAALLSDLGLSPAVLGVIMSDSDSDIDDQLLGIAQEMGFADELSAMLQRTHR